MFVLVNAYHQLNETCYLASAQTIADMQPALLEKEQQRFGGFLLRIKRALDSRSFLVSAVPVAFALASPEHMLVSPRQFNQILILPDWEKPHLLFR